MKGGLLQYPHRGVIRPELRHFQLDRQGLPGQRRRGGIRQLQAQRDPALHSALGEALRPLRDEGVLVMGSGMSYHNLRNFSAGGPESLAFDNWLDSALAGNCAERTERLAQWDSAPGGRASHPREEHLIPLMVASGAGSNAPARKMWTGLVGPTHVSGWAFD